jgi:hypothetical protein
MAKDPGRVDNQLPTEPKKWNQANTPVHGGSQDSELRSSDKNLISLHFENRCDTDGLQKDEKTLPSPMLGKLQTSPTRKLSAIPQHTEGVDRGILPVNARPLSGIACRVFPHNKHNKSDMSGVGSVVLGTVAEDETPSAMRSRLTGGKSATESSPAEAPRAVVGELTIPRSSTKSPGASALRESPSVVGSRLTDSKSATANALRESPPVVGSRLTDDKNATSSSLSASSSTTSETIGVQLAKSSSASATRSTRSVRDSSALVGSSVRSVPTGNESTTGKSSSTRVASASGEVVREEPPQDATDLWGRRVTEAN